MLLNFVLLVVFAHNFLADHGFNTKGHAIRKTATIIRPLELEANVCVCVNAKRFEMNKCAIEIVWFILL